MYEPIFKDEEPVENRKYCSVSKYYNDEPDEVKRNASILLNIMAFVCMLIIPYLSYINNPELAAYSFCAGIILAAISAYVNKKSKASRVILTGGAAVIIILAAITLITIIEILMPVIDFLTGY